MINDIEIINNELYKSVCLYNFLEEDKLNDSIYLSDGTCQAASTAKTPYMKSAYIPSSPWRTPTHKEIEAILTKKVPFNYSASVGLLQLPQKILEPFTKLGLKNIEARDEFYDTINSIEGKLAIANAIEFISTCLVNGDEFQTISIFNQPGLNSTAYVPERNCYIGLHIDYLYGQSIYEKNNSANRISINLGKEDRYLIYVNLTAKDLIEIVKPQNDCTNDDLVLKFFEKFPKYPVIRVRIRPGEAYIAPTQNIIHDGIGSKLAPDIHLTICGHIGFSGISNSLKNFNTP